MKHRFLLILSLCALFYVKGNNALPLKDSTVKGVQFDNGRWDQILRKAKKEKKYIFVDCYTTWCGPCKLMDKEVYTKPEVGDYINSHFIAVKMQMDKAPNDDEQTRSRYPDAELIEKQNGISGYPTYFVLSPDGKLMSRGIGLKYPDDFLGFVTSAIDPKASHPYARYYAKLSDYQKGKRDFTAMPQIIDTALQLRQQDVVDSVSKNYSAYLKTLSDEQLYDPQIITYLSARVQNSDSRYFHLFHPNEEKINALMGKNGYAQLVVGNIIKNEIITPAMHDGAEPDWNLLTKTITDTYGNAYAEENILKARAKYCDNRHDRPNQFKYFTLLLQKYSANMETTIGDECDNFMDCDLNSWCWMLFKYSVDKEQIDVAIQCMQDVLRRYKQRGGEPEAFIDTYANLLYKAGKSAEAIAQEERIIEILTKANATVRAMAEYKTTLERMREGKPTWPHYIDGDNLFFSSVLL